MFNYARTAFNRLMAAEAPEVPHRDPEAPSSSASPTDPTNADVHVVKAMLAQAGRLPLELVDVIIDLAGYWPHTTTKLFLGHPGSGDQTTSFQGNAFLIRTPPLGFFQPPYPDKQAYGRTKPEARPVSGRTYTAAEARRWLGPRAPRLAHPCRRIVFYLVSHDQGWASSAHDRERPFAGSYSWFDVGLERFEEADEANEVKDDGSTSSTSSKSTPPPLSALRSIRPPVKDTGRFKDGVPVYELDHPLLPGADRLQANRVAKRSSCEYRIVWDWTDDVAPDDVEADELERIGRGGATGDGSFVRSLQVGDVVTLWAKARFPGWANKVQLVEVAVYWAV